MLSANFNIMPNKAPIHIMITGFFFFIAITADVITIINDIRLSDVNIFETYFPTVNTFPATDKTAAPTSPTTAGFIPFITATTTLLSLNFL